MRWNSELLERTWEKRTSQVAGSGLRDPGPRHDSVRSVASSVRAKPGEREAVIPSGMGRGAEFTMGGRGVISAGFALPRDAGRRPPPGETHMIGSARSPRPHEKVVRNSRRQGAASSALVSRSRACRPEVGVPWPAAPLRPVGYGSRGAPRRKWGVRRLAPLRGAVPV